MHKKFSNSFTALILGLSLSGLAVWGCTPVQAQIPDSRVESQLVQMAREGDIEAVYNLAMSYIYGDKVYTNYKEAAKLLEKAIKAEYYPAYGALAFLYVHGWGVSFDGEKAFELCKQGAAHQDSRSIYGLGVCYDYGIGVLPNLATARDYYRKAASAGCYLGWHGLARLETAQRSPYANAKLCKEFSAKALQTWLDSDSLFFQSEMRSDLRNCPEYIERCIEKLKKGLDPHSITYSISAAQYFSLAEAFYEKYLNITKSPDDRFNAYNFASDAIDLNYLPAQVTLAQLLNDRKDHEQAFTIFRYLSAEGDSQSTLALARYAEKYPHKIKQQFWPKILLNLKKFDYHGVYRSQAHYLLLTDPDNLAGSEVSAENYLSLLHKAADGGDGEACLELSDIYNTGEVAGGRWSVEEDQDKAFAYLAAPLANIYPLDYSDPLIKYRFAALGDRYLYGKGTQVNTSQAALCYERSLSLGYNDRAAYRLGSLLFKHENQEKRARGRRLLRRVAQEANSPYAFGAKRLLQ
ncbi:MAG: hypothetical protein ACI376_07205 [Candidatus Bruticola sp.]